MGVGCITPGKLAGKISLTSLADLEPAAPLVELFEAVTRIEGG